MSNILRQFIWIIIHCIVFVSGLLMLSKVIAEKESISVSICIGFMLMIFSWFILVSQKIEDTQISAKNKKHYKLVKERDINEQYPLGEYDNIEDALKGGLFAVGYKIVADGDKENEVF